VKPLKPGESRWTERGTVRWRPPPYEDHEHRDRRALINDAVANAKPFQLTLEMSLREYMENHPVK